MRPHRSSWPCWRCAAPGVKNLGTDGYCATHLADFYRSLDPMAWCGVGVGLAAGRHRPDHGPEMWDLACVLCDATWVGPILDVCSWCHRRLEGQRRAQVHLLLSAELPVEEDALMVRVDRLARGVAVGLITRAQAHAALDRGGRHAS